MHRILVPLAAALLASACASLDSDQPLTRTDCKVAPLTLASSTGGKPRQADSLDQRYAEMQLAGSDYRRRQFNQPLGAFSNVEQALRDCDEVR